MLRGMRNIVRRVRSSGLPKLCVGPRLLLERLVAAWCLAWVGLVILVALLAMAVALGAILAVVTPYKWLTGKHILDSWSGHKILI